MPPHTAVLDRSSSDSSVSTMDEAKSDVEDSGKTFGPRRHYPFKWVPISDEERMRRREVYYSHGPWCVSPKATMLDLVYSVPGNVLMPRAFTNIAEDIYNFDVRPGDVFVVTYPKCGTTWTQEMVWQILHGLDLEQTESLLIRSPFLEMEALASDDVGQDDNNNALPVASNHCGGNASTVLNPKVLKGLEAARNMDSPRVLKTHLPLDMLPPNLLELAKVVFVARNPMDCCVSFYHHEKLVPNQGFSGSFDQYADLFRHGRNPTGDYFYHLKSGWSRREHPNLKFIWYEDMKFDLRTVIRETAEFLDHPLQEDQIRELQGYLHIDNFRKNRAVNMEENYGNSGGGRFIRKGSVGGWRAYFDASTVDGWREWVRENTQGTGLEFCLD